MTNTGIDDQFWVSTTTDGREAKYGPYLSFDAAGIAAARITAMCHLFRIDHTEPVERHGRLAQRVVPRQQRRSSGGSGNGADDNGRYYRSARPFDSRRR